MERMMEVFGPKAQLTSQQQKTLEAMATDQPARIDWQALAKASPVCQVVCESEDPEPRLAAFLMLHDLFEEGLIGYRTSHDHFWRYSLRTGIASELIGTQILNLANPLSLFLAGLVHDIGKFALDEAVLQQQDAFLKARQDTSKPISFDTLEKLIIKDTHAEISAKLLQAWDMPDDFCQMVAFHHNPSHAPQHLHKCALAVHLGDMFAMMAGWGTELDRLAYDIDPLADHYVKKDARWELKIFPKLLLDIDQRYEQFPIHQEQGGNA